MENPSNQTNESSPGALIGVIIILIIIVLGGIYFLNERRKENRLPLETNLETEINVP